MPKHKKYSERVTIPMTHQMKERISNLSNLICESELAFKYEPPSQNTIIRMALDAGVEILETKYRE